MNATAAILRQAAKILKQTGRVERGRHAADRKGKDCKPHHRRAVSFDAQGALYRVVEADIDETADKRHLSAALCFLDLAAGLLHRMTIVRVNDELGFEAVLSCYRQAWLVRATRMTPSAPRRRAPDP